LYEEPTNVYKYPTLHVSKDKNQFDYWLSMFNMYEIRAGEISRECAIASFGIKEVELAENGMKPMNLKYTIQQPVATVVTFGNLVVGDYFYTTPWPNDLFPHNKKPAIWRKFVGKPDQYNAMALDGTIYKFIAEQKVVQVEPSGELTFLVK
jgi:hypothetical protein